MTPTISKPAIADRISLISVSSTMKVMADADKLRREGIDVVDFSAGEPDFPTPDNVKLAAVKALDQNFTKYTAVSGVVDEGLKTTVLPATSAGAIFQAGIHTGKFQGVINVTTPRGCLNV